MILRVARICARCNTVVRPGDAPCPSCDSAPARKNDKQTIMVDGPTHMATDDPMFRVDPNDKWKRRVVPNKAAYREHIARSNGRLESAG